MTDPIQLDLCRSSKPEKQMALFCKFGLSWENKWKSVKTSGTNLESPALSSTQRHKIISKNEMSYVQPLVPGVKSTDCVMKKGSETLHDKQEKIGGQRVLLSKAPLTWKETSNLPFMATENIGEVMQTFTHWINWLANSIYPHHLQRETPIDWIIGLHQIHQDVVHDGPSLHKSRLINEGNKGCNLEASTLVILCTPLPHTKGL